MSNTMYFAHKISAFTFSDQEKVEAMKANIMSSIVKNDTDFRDKFHAIGYPIPLDEEWMYEGDWNDECDKLFRSLKYCHVTRPAVNDESIYAFLEQSLAEYTDGTMKLGLVIDDHYTACQRCEMGDDFCNCKMFAKIMITADLDRTFPTTNYYWGNQRRIVVFEFANDDTVLTCIAQIMAYLSDKFGDMPSDYYFSDCDVPEVTASEFTPGGLDFIIWLKGLELLD